MKTYTLEKTSDPKLFRVVDRNGDWLHYFHEPSKTYLRAVNYVLDSGYVKGRRFEQYLKNTPREEIEKKLKVTGDKGDAVHKFIAALFVSNGKADRTTEVWDDDLKQARKLTNDEWDAVLAFASFWEKHQPKLYACEAAVYSLKVGYAGTLDAVLALTKECGIRTCPCKGLIGKIGLFDWKTGSGIWSSYGAQLAAYAGAENLKQYLAGGKLAYTAILRIGTNHKLTGGYELCVHDAKETKRHQREFLSALTIADADYEPFDPKKEIYDIPDVLNLMVEKIIPKPSSKHATQGKKEHRKIAVGS